MVSTGRNDVALRISTGKPLTYLPFQPFQRRYIFSPSNAFGWKRTKTNTVSLVDMGCWLHFIMGYLIHGGNPCLGVRPPMLWKWLVLLTLKGIFRCFKNFYIYKPGYRLISHPFKCNWKKAKQTNKPASEPHYVLLLTQSLESMSRLTWILKRILLAYLSHIVVSVR